MKKSEIFNLLLEEVAWVCEVSKESIINGTKIQAVVDARLLMVQYLRRIGLSNDDIALTFIKVKGLEPDLAQIKKKANGINKMFNSYSERCLQSYSFCLMSQEVAKFCRDEYQLHYFEAGAGMKQLPK